MIGVFVPDDERDLAAEFFQLCKTAWEYWRPEGRYAVILSTLDLPQPAAARLALLYRSQPTSSDRLAAVAHREEPAGLELSWWGRPLPIYGRATLFPGEPDRLLRDPRSNLAAVCHRTAGETVIVHVGYDLFAETRILLGAGQPRSSAAIPTLDRHIEIFRELVCTCGVPFAEIPPVPDGHRFIACLTHDIDQPRLGSHGWDRTTLGFLHRATLGSLLDAVTGRRSVRALRRNWAAAARLPLLHLRMARDPWRDFDRYLQFERGLSATYFVIPVSRHPGRLASGRAPAHRASDYDLADIAPQMARVRAAGAEISVHGIDAWLDAQNGRFERESVSRFTGTAARGIRMHWLYFDADSPARLEEAGYGYDSSIGYNETVGYKAGTAQVFRPLGTRSLLELPLHVMDTALFSSSRLHLRRHEAQRLLLPMIGHARSGGGVLTVNWHDRSIAPERLWDDFYAEMLRKLRRSGAWFPTAGQAVAWFSMRRGARLWTGPLEPDGSLLLHVEAPSDGRLPGLKLRLHLPAETQANDLFAKPAAHTSSDMTLNGAAQLRIHL